MNKISYLISICFWILSTNLYTQSTYLVLPDGTGDFPNIQAAINTARPGDTINLGDGLFQGDGNFNIRLNGKAITIKSLSGNAKDCIINPGIVNGENRRGFWIDGGESPDAVVRDLTIYKAGSLAQ